VAIPWRRASATIWFRRAGGAEERIGADEKHRGPLLDERAEGHVDLALAAGFQEDLSGTEINQRGSIYKGAFV
jgi:hypothetical protein